MLRDLAEYALRHRTEVAHGRLLTALHEHVLWMSTHDDEGAEDAVGCARHMMILAQQLKIMAVLKARVVYEAPWAEVAAMLGLDEADARKIYEDAERRWLGGDLTPWLPQPGQRPAVRPMLRRLLGGGGG